MALALLSPGPAIGKAAPAARNPDKAPSRAVAPTLDGPGFSLALVSADVVPTGLAGNAPLSRGPAGPTESGAPLALAERGARMALAASAELPPVDAPVVVAVAGSAAAAGSPRIAYRYDDAPAPTMPPPSVADDGDPEPAVVPAKGAAVEPPEGAVESLRDAIVASLKSNPEIQISLAQQDDVRYGVNEAVAAWMPHVDVSAGYGHEMAKAGTQPSTWRNRLEGTATLTQNVWDFGVTLNDIRRARASYRSAQWATREKIEAISYDITSAYVGVLQQQKLVALAEEEARADKRVLRMVTVQKDLGLTTAADVSRAQAQLDNTNSQILDRKSALQQARLGYRRLTGHLPAIAQELAPATPMLPASVEQAVDMIDNHNPRLAQAVEDRRSLARQYASQTGTFFPRIGLMVQANHKYDVLGKTGLADDARAMVTVSYNLFNGGADRAVRNRIAARMREADYELDRRRREVEQNIRTDFDALDAARRKIATIDAEIEAAQKVVDLYRQQFREGRRTVFEILDSERTLYAAKANQIVNRTAMNLAEYRVLQGLGGLFDLVSDKEPLPPLVVPAPVKR
ncbi:MAG: TolC family outer membrane protein [Sphingomonadales bacterium]|nr:TolC family outer membrane protein [Sphingomonadales bacterium]